MTDTIDGGNTKDCIHLNGVLELRVCWTTDWDGMLNTDGWMMDERMGGVEETCLRDALDQQSATIEMDGVNMEFD